jgi:hypothetical protein
VAAAQSTVVADDAVHPGMGEDSNEKRVATASSVAKCAGPRWSGALDIIGWRSRCGDGFGSRLSCLETDAIGHQIVSVGCAMRRESWR